MKKKGTNTTMADFSTPDKPHSAAASSSETSPFFNYINNLSPLELVKYRNKTGIGHQAFDSANYATPSPISTSGHLKFVTSSSTRCQVSELGRSSSKHRETPEFDKRAQGLECLASKDEVVKVDLAAQEAPEVNLGCISTERLSYDSKRDLRRITRLGGGDPDEVERDWVAVVSELADELTLNSLYIMEEGEDTELQEQQNQEVLLVPKDESNFVSDVLQIPQGFGVVGENQREDQIHGGRCKELVVCDASEKTGLSQKQHKARRRCLVFEMAGGQKRKSQSDDPMASSSALDDKKEDACLSREGIGLHLNSIVTSSEVVEIQCLSSIKSSSNLDETKHNAAPSSTRVVANCGDHSSPERKRLKVVHIKNCNCKRSKCLKLYCECFAAGLYCMESCSCQGCSNDHANETTVLETRRLILSRNPLAFGPKVITRFGGGMNAATPASARHKKGCNCRKSHCLKRYCECFEGGVGCSPNCRCIDCCNTFGTNNVTFLLGMAAHGNEESEALGMVRVRKSIA